MPCVSLASLGLVPIVNTTGEFLPPLLSTISSSHASAVGWPCSLCLNTLRASSGPM